MPALLDFSIDRYTEDDPKKSQKEPRDEFGVIIMDSGAMIGGYLGARYTNLFSERNLKRVIGLILIVVAITMFLRVFKIGWQ